MAAREPDSSPAGRHVPSGGGLADLRGGSPLNDAVLMQSPFIVLVAQRYKKTAGLGTIVAMMIPFSVVVLVVCLLFFVAWFALGIPMGPGYPASL